MRLGTNNPGSILLLLINLQPDPVTSIPTNPEIVGLLAVENKLIIVYYWRKLNDY